MVEILNYKVLNTVGVIVPLASNPRNTFLFANTDISHFVAFAVLHFGDTAFFTN